jgi:broad specificity phosphatase PhoE
MTLFYIFRHGQTDFNVNHTIQGQKFDPSLNDNGKKQAEFLAQKLKDVKFDLLLSSTQQRAVDTIKAVNKYHNVEVIYDELLREGCFGDAEGLTEEKAAEKFADVYQKWLTMKYGDVRFPGGEAQNEIADRIFKVLNRYTGKNLQNVGVATHSDVICAMLMRLGVIKSYIENGDVIVLEHNAGKFTIK